MRCPSCNHDNRPDRRFCTECGATLSVACPSCGAPAEAGEKFCGGCGVSLVAASDKPKAESQTASAGLTPNPLTPNPLSSGERRQLTVLFSDLVGSTELSTQFDPEEWREIVSRYQRTTTEAVQKFGGHVAKNLGDGLLIYFGWPTAREDDPERAVRAGLAIIEEVEGLGVTGLRDRDPTLTPDPLTPYQ
jgi:hypothetical protein